MRGDVLYAIEDRILRLGRVRSRALDIQVQCRIAGEE